MSNTAQFQPRGGGSVVGGPPLTMSNANSHSYRRHLHFPEDNADDDKTTENNDDNDAGAADDFENDLRTQLSPSPIPTTPTAIIKDLSRVDPKLLGGVNVNQYGILSAHELRPARRQWNYHLPRRFWA